MIDWQRIEDLTPSDLREGMAEASELNLGLPMAMIMMAWDTVMASGDQDISGPVARAFYGALRDELRRLKAGEHANI